MVDLSAYMKNSRLKIIAKPNSPKTEIKEYDSKREALRVNVHARPENNQANIEIIKFFRRLTGKEVRIASGLTSKEKVLEFV